MAVHHEGSGGSAEPFWSEGKSCLQTVTLKRVIIGVDGKKETRRTPRSAATARDQPSIAKAKQICHQQKMAGIQGFFEFVGL